MTRSKVQIHFECHFSILHLFHFRAVHNLLLLYTLCISMCIRIRSACCFVCVMRYCVLYTHTRARYTHATIHHHHHITHAHSTPVTQTVRSANSRHGTPRERAPAREKNTIRTAMSSETNSSRKRDFCFQRADRGSTIKQRCFVSGAQGLQGCIFYVFRHSHAFWGAPSFGRMKARWQ